MTRSEETRLLAMLNSSKVNEAVMQLYRTCYEPVTYWIQGQGGSEEDAADLFQETILIFIEQVRQQRFRGDSSVPTYLTGIARNLWYNEQRSRSRRTNREEQYADGGETISHNAEQRLHSRENRQKLLQLFEQIGDVCKKLLTGFYFENLSMKELLVITAYSNEQVLRNKKSKCMKHLKDLIEADNELTETFKTYPAYDE
jgi:RNA polymerase sigma factor (sigma-70 family)